MGGKWTTAKIADIAEKLAMGPFGSNIKAENFVPSGVPIIRGNNLTSGRFNGGGFVYLTEAKADELRTANAFPDDIVFTHRGTLGQVGIVPQRPFSRYVVSQSQMKLTCKRKVVDPLFVYYFFKSPQGQHALLMNTSQTGVPAISRPLTSLKQIAMPYPPLSEQQRIADIFGSLDDKIELNRRTNETLEAMAKALFKSWFVDFDPVVAKSEGRQPDRMDAETAKLFPSSFVDSEIGRVPKGWRVSKLGDVLEFAYGKPLKEEDRQPGAIPVFGSNGQIGWHNQRLVCGPGIVVGRKGNPGIIKWAPTDFFPIDTTFYVITKERSTSLRYLFFALLNQNLSLLGADSAVPGLNRNQAYMSLQLIPPPDILKAFDAAVTSLFDRAHASALESVTIAIVRDSLLPKLLSGELAVPSSKVA
jgi:type I restriction enzyme S subunit